MRCRCYVTPVLLLALTPARGVAEARAAEEIELDAVLVRAHQQARRWHWGWLGVMAVGATTQGTLTAVLPQDAQGRMAQGLAALPPLVGLTLQLTGPLAALDWPEDRAAAEAQADPALRLQAKRKLVVRYAKSERRKRNWFAHLGPFSLHAAVGATIAFLLDRPVQGAIQFAAGMTVSQTQLWTSPRAASRAADSLRQTAWLPRLVPRLGPRYQGLSLVW